MLPYDYNFIILVLEHACMIFATTVKLKYQNSGEPLFTDLDRKGVQSTKNKTEPPY